MARYLPEELRLFLAEFFTVSNLAGEVLASVLIAGAGAIALWFFQFPFDKQMYWVYIPAAIFICLVVFGFLNQRGRRFDMPQLRASIDGYMLGNAEDDTASTLMIMFVSLRNHGMPSIAEGWQLSIRTASHQIVRASMRLVPPVVSVKSLGGEEIQYSGQDALYEKAIQAPIPTGGLVRGILFFVFERMARDVVGRSGSVLTLTFNDVSGKVYLVSTTAGEQTSPFLYYPGLQRISGEEIKRIHF